MAKDAELIRLLRMVHGEASVADSEQLRRRMETDDELRRVFERWSVVWDDLRPPPAAMLTEAGTRAMVRRVLAAESQADWGWRAAPTWARATGALALAAGVVAGSAVAAPFMEPDLGGWGEEATLAESYETLFYGPRENGGDER